ALQINLVQASPANSPDQLYTLPNINNLNAAYQDIQPHPPLHMAQGSPQFPAPPQTQLPQAFGPVQMANAPSYFATSAVPPQIAPTTFQLTQAVPQVAPTAAVQFPP